jgi:transposase-like protein
MEQQKNENGECSLVQEFTYLFYQVLPTENSALEMELHVILQNIRGLPKPNFELFIRAYNVLANSKFSSYEELIREIKVNLYDMISELSSETQKELAKKQLEAMRDYLTEAFVAIKQIDVDAMSEKGRVDKWILNNKHKFFSIFQSIQRHHDCYDRSELLPLLVDLFVLMRRKDG